MDKYMGELIQRGRKFGILVRYVNIDWQVVQTWTDAAGRAREKRIMSGPTQEIAEAMAREVIATSDGAECTVAF